LQTMAQESGLVIEPNGDGVRLARLGLPQAPRGVAAGRRAASRELPPQQSRDRLRQQTLEAEARSQQQLPAAGPALAERQEPEQLRMRRDAKAETSVWSLAWGDLPARQFGEANTRMAAARKTANAPAIKETF